MSRRKVQLRSQSIREDVRGAGALRVDRQAGVIHGVKVLGLESDNGRRYLPEAVRRAAPMYEGRSVRINHPRRPDDSRESEDVFGWLEGVQVGEDGSLYGDLHYLTAHPMAERIAEAAEKNPRLFGLSHNAEGKGDSEGGVFVVHEITEVRSVDLVADPATTSGLFESKGTRRMKLKAFFEAIQLEAKIRKRVLGLFEAGKCLAGYSEHEMEGEGEPEKMDHNEALHQGFKSAMHALVDEDEMEPGEKHKRMGELMKAHEKMCSDGEEDVAEGDEEGEGEEGEDKMESKQLRRQVKQLKTREHCRELCEAVSLTPSKTLLKALVALGSDEDRQALLEESRTPGTKPSKPRSQAPGGRPLTEARLPEKPDDVLAWLRN